MIYKTKSNALLVIHLQPYCLLARNHCKNVKNTIPSVNCPIFTARCYAERSCRSMSSELPSVTLVDCDDTGWNSFENNFTVR